MFRITLSIAKYAFAGLSCVFLFIPMVVVIILAFSSAQNMSFPPPGFSMQWFEQFISSHAFTSSLYTSLLVAAIAASIGTIAGLPAALWISRSYSGVARLLEALLLSPLFIATVALGVLLSQFYSLVGIAKSLFAIALGHSLLGTAYVGRLSLASLRRVGLAPERAARSLGCPPLEAIVRVTLPRAKAGIAAGFIFAVLISLDDINIALFLSDVYTTTLPVRIFSYVQQNSDPFAAAVSTIMIVIAFVFLFVCDRLVGLDTLFGVDT